MPSPWTSRVAMLSLAVAASGVLVATAQQKPDPLTLGPARERGASVTPAFEGWYQNEDGSFSLLIGYFNRNSKEPLDIPVGPNNRIEPGDPDQGQPTHFETGRQWGVFVLKVPKDFGKKSFTWTIVANGEPQSIPLSLNPGYPVTPLQGTRHGQPAAGAVLLSRGRQGHRAAGEGSGHPDGQGRSTGADSGVGGGSEA